MNVPLPPYHETINQLLYAILQHFEGNIMNVPRPPYYNVTNDLLYAILNKINRNGGQVIYNQFRILYVSSRYGDDSTAEANNIDKPYKTINAAKNSSFFNDLIHVMEGSYDEGNLFGNYRYWFDFGAEVNYSGSGAIFQNMLGVCTVRGFGKFKGMGNAIPVNVGNWLYCVLDMECESIEANAGAVVYWQNNFVGGGLYKPHRIKAKKIYSSDLQAITFLFNSYGEIEADEIISDSFSEGAVVVGSNLKGTINDGIIIGNNYSAVRFAGNGVEAVFDNCEIICNSNVASHHGILMNGTVEHLRISDTSISCVNEESKSIYVIPSVDLYIDSNVSSNRDTGGAGSITYKNKGNKINLEENEATIDITGASSIDLNNFQNAEIIRLASANPVETLSEINSAPKHHSFKIIPSVGLTLTLVSSSPTTAGDTSIILESLTLSLHGDNGDWMELHNGLYGIGNRQVNASNY